MQINMTYLHKMPIWFDLIQNVLHPVEYNKIYKADIKNRLGISAKIESV